METINYYFPKSKFNIYISKTGKRPHFTVTYKGWPVATVTPQHQKYKSIRAWWNKSESKRSQMYGFIRHTVNRAIKDYFIRNSRCKSCGTKDTRVFDFDHLNKKLFNISAQLARGAPEKCLQEIRKTQILCTNCHRIKTLNKINGHLMRPHFALHNDIESTIKNIGRS